MDQRAAARSALQAEEHAVRMGSHSRAPRARDNRRDMCAPQTAAVQSHAAPPVVLVQWSRAAAQGHQQGQRLAVTLPSFSPRRKLPQTLPALEHT
ncbi:hypothetical protein TREES_T100017607 [Tupaia chinensis]|uniref:Uncharacterized protein n=1 Tax=Tupaia chinensis TaxID=246437 RepID=L9L3P9_TUPCH|nr:hypothetical protein TREES_T100017607 [Tupaia chinensis]